MNYLTNYYKNRCDQLQEQINFLQRRYTQDFLNENFDIKQLDENILTKIKELLFGPKLERPSARYEYPEEPAATGRDPTPNTPEQEKAIEAHYRLLKQRNAEQDEYHANKRRAEAAAEKERLAREDYQRLHDPVRKREQEARARIEAEFKNSTRSQFARDLWTRD